MREIKFNIPPIHVHIHGLSDTDPGRLARIENLLGRLAAAAAISLINEGRTMKSIDDIIAQEGNVLSQVQRSSSVQDAIIQLVQAQNAKMATLKAEVDQLQASGSTDPAKLQQLSDMIDTMLSSETANADKVANAVAANTLADPNTQNAGKQPEPINPAPQTTTQSGNTGQ